MLVFENTVQIRRPVEAVFAFLADLENLPRWNYYVLEVRKTSDGPIQVGTTYHQIRKTDEQDLRITELEPYHTVAVETLPPYSPSLVMTFTLEEDGGATRVRDEWKLETGRPALLERLAARNVRSAAAGNLGKLKQLLEEGQAVLQDGRRMTL